MKRRYKVLLSILIIIIIIISATYHLLRYPADNVLVKPIMQETSYGWVIESQIRGENKGDIVYHQGAFVDAKAYLPLAEKLALVGFNVYILDSWFDLPILSVNQAKNVIKQESIERPILMGHSLGGVVASMVAENISNKGLILLASYPSQNTDISKEEIRVLSFVASKDLIMDHENWTQAKSRLPEESLYINLNGGNHSQFGQYGHQKGDGVATITMDEQMDLIVNEIEKVFGE